MKRKIFQTIIIAVLFFCSAPAVAMAAEIPAEIVEYAEELGAQYNICPELIEAIIFEESSFKADATNGNCKGLMQINSACHAKRMEKLGVADLYDPKQNMLVGTDYLSELFRTYEDIGTVLLIYNGSGKARVNSYEATGKMTGYVERILARSERYEREHYK